MIVLLKRGTFDGTHIEGRRGEDTECHLETKGDPNTSAGSEVCNRFSSRPQKEPTLPTAPSWTSSLENCETINFCCQATQFVVFLMAAPGHQDTDLVIVAPGGLVHCPSLHHPRVIIKLTVFQHSELPKGKDSV